MSNQNVLRITVTAVTITAIALEILVNGKQTVQISIGSLFTKLLPNVAHGELQIGIFYIILSRKSMKNIQLCNFSSF